MAAADALVGEAFSISPWKEALAERDALLAELRAARQDAERYRYVRACPHMLLHLSNRDFDAAIDAARYLADGVKP